MKKVVTSLLLIFILLSGARSQITAGLDLGIGVGSYQLNSLKEVQQILLDGFPVEGKITNLFPPYSIFRINYIRPINEKLNLGLIYQNGSTGARASYEDYSGSVYADQLLTMYQFGGSASYRLLYSNYIELRAYGLFMLSLTSDEITRETFIPGYYLREYLKVKARNPVFEPGIELLYHRDKYSFGIDAGYQYDFGAKYVVKETNEYFYHPENSTQIIKTEISGFRASLKFIIWIWKEEAGKLY